MFDTKPNHIEYSREQLSILMGALHWLAGRYEALPNHDPAALKVIERVLHGEPRVIAKDINRFRRYYLDAGFPENNLRS